MTLHPVLAPVPQKGPRRSPEQARRQRHGARLALQHCAALCGAPLDGWTKSEDEVPLPNDGFHWSISHKPLWAAAVIARQPVGIDIEQVVPRRQPLHEALASPSEWTLMGSRSWRAFYRLWTAKEAVLKANGAGIAELRSCRLVGRPEEDRLTLEFQARSWQVALYSHQDHVAAVAGGAASVKWRVLSAGRGAAAASEASS